jgi:hypothetical protein
MAYLDTGELPWDMDLFDGQAEKVRTQPPFMNVGTKKTIQEYGAAIDF